MTTRIPSAATAEGVSAKAPSAAPTMAGGVSIPITTDFDYKRAFQDLEDLVNRTQMAARLASYLAHEDMRPATSGNFIICETQGDFIQFAARVAEDYADRLHDKWLEAHNESARLEWAAMGRPAPEAGL